MIPLQKIVMLFALNNIITEISLLLLKQNPPADVLSHRARKSHADQYHQYIQVIMWDSLSVYWAKIQAKNSITPSSIPIYVCDIYCAIMLEIS